jgi:Flp pilus assembly protein TadG
MKNALSRRTPARRRGSALIEFALSFGIIFPLFYGTFQFAVAFQRYGGLISAVRAGGRYASYRTYDSATSSPSAAYLAAVRNAVVYGNPAGGTVPVAPGLTPAHVNVQMGMWEGIPKTVRVSIKNYPLQVFFTKWNLNKPEAIFPFTGRYAAEPES